MKNFGDTKPKETYNYLAPESQNMWLKRNGNGHNHSRNITNSRDEIDHLIIKNKKSNYHNHKIDSKSIISESW